MSDLKNEDWVRYKSKNAYIESIREGSMYAIITVPNTDIYRRRVFIEDIEHSQFEVMSGDIIDQLIDVALDLNDKEWFEELCRVKLFENAVEQAKDKLQMKNKKISPKKGS